MKKTTQMLAGLFVMGLLAPGALANKGHHGHHKACKADMDKFCPGKHGHDKKACVEQNKAQFSQPCQEEMAKHEHHDGPEHPEKH